MVLNLTFLLLSRALGAAETYHGEDKQKGMTYIPFIVFSSVFAVIWTIMLVLVCLNGASIEFWDNMTIYYNVHLASDYKCMFGIMFLAGCCVMGSMIYNFNLDHIREEQGVRAKIAIGICVLLIVINFLHVIFLLIFPLTVVMGFISFSFFLCACCGLLPFLSHMILKLEAEGQAKGLEGDSWTLAGGGDYDAMSVASGQSYNDHIN